MIVPFLRNRLSGYKSIYYAKMNLILICLRQKPVGDAMLNFKNQMQIHVVSTLEIKVAIMSACGVIDENYV